MSKVWKLVIFPRYRRYFSIRRHGSLAYFFVCGIILDAVKCLESEIIQLTIKQ